MIRLDNPFVQVFPFNAFILKSATAYFLKSKSGSFLFRVEEVYCERRIEYKVIYFTSKDNSCAQ